MDIKDAEDAFVETAREGARLVSLSLAHRVTKLPKEPDKRQFFQVDVWLDGPDDIRDDVRSVEYELHHTFTPNKITRTTPLEFKLSLKIWGEFTIKARVLFIDGTSVDLVRYLSLTMTK